MGRVENKVAFITGGARGQGRAHAVALAREGADIVITDICAPIPETPQYQTATPEDLKETASQVEALDRRCLAIIADARDTDAMSSAVAQTIDELGRIDILCINHGLFTAGPWDSITDENWNTVIEGDLSSQWRCARLVIPHMITQGGGSIVFTASTGGLKAIPGLLPYCVAKHGIIGLTRGLAVELGPHNIRVNAVCPSNVGTPMLLNDGIYELFTGKPGATQEDFSWPAKNTNLLPVAWVEPEDVANAVVYLASDDGRFVTGSAMAIDAGYMNLPSGIPPLAAQRLGELDYLAELKSSHGG